MVSLSIRYRCKRTNIHGETIVPVLLGIAISHLKNAIYYCLDMDVDRITCLSSFDKCALYMSNDPIIYV